MFIQTESTPNPATLKFLPGHTKTEQQIFRRVKILKNHHWPKEFLVLKAYQEFFGSDFITVTKK